jgi:uncharacterized protein YrrD
MEIRLGAQLVGRDGTLGEVRGLIVEAQSNHVTDLVVRHHGLRRFTRVVPLAHVTRIDGDSVHVDLDEHAFAALDGFVDDRYHAPNREYTPPGSSATTFSMDAAVAAGGISGHMGSLPGGQSWPDDVQRAAVAPGTPVRDAIGEVIGHVSGLQFTAETGTPTQLSMRRGHLIRHDTVIPVSCIKEIADDGILLTVTERELADLAREHRAEDS